MINTDILHLYHEELLEPWSDEELLESWSDEELLEPWSDEELLESWSVMDPIVTSKRRIIEWIL